MYIYIVSREYNHVYFKLTCSIMMWVNWRSIANFDSLQNLHDVMLMKIDMEITYELKSGCIVSKEKSTNITKSRNW